MISQDQFFELISLVSSESKKADPLFEQSMELLSKIELNFSQFINEQAFQGRSELKHQLNKAIAEAQLQVSLPMLSNRHNLVVIGKNAKTNLEILQSISKYMHMHQEFEQAFKRIALLKLPVIFYHGRPQEPATVYNLVDNIVSLDLDKLCAFFNLGARDESQDSSKLALAKPMDLAQLCAVPLEFKDEFKDLNLIFMSELSQDKNHQRLLSMSQSALVIPSEHDAPCDFGEFPLDVKVYADNAKQELAQDYVAACKSLAMRKGQGPLQIDTIAAEKLVSFLKSKSQSTININILPQLQAISYNLSLNLKQNDSAVKGRIEGINRFLLETHTSEPIVKKMLSQAQEQQQSINQQLVQSNEFNHVVFESVSELIELFNKRGFNLQSQDTLAAGGVLAWRQLFELGALTHDIPLMHRSIRARKDCDETVKKVQKLHVEFVEGQVSSKGVISSYLNDQDCLCTDACRHSLIRICSDMHDESGLNRLAKYVTQSVPLERRNTQENLLVGKYLTAQNNNTVNSQSQEAFEAALFQGETEAIDHLVTSYLQEAQNTGDDSKLRGLALTYNPQAAFEYACLLQTRNNPEFNVFMLISTSQSYEPALKFYADYCFEIVTTEHPVVMLRKLYVPQLPGFQDDDFSSDKKDANKVSSTGNSTKVVRRKIAPSSFSMSVFSNITAIGELSRFKVYVSGEKFSIDLSAKEYRKKLVKSVALSINQIFFPERRNQTNWMFDLLDAGNNLAFPTFSRLNNFTYTLSSPKSLPEHSLGSAICDTVVDFKNYRDTSFQQTTNLFTGLLAVRSKVNIGVASGLGAISPDLSMFGFGDGIRRRQFSTSKNVQDVSVVEDGQTDSAFEEAVSRYSVGSNDSKVRKSVKRKNSEQEQEQRQEQARISSILDSICQLGIHSGDNCKDKYWPLETTPLPQELALKAQQALAIYKNMGSQIENVEAKQGRLLYMLDHKIEAMPYLEKAAANGDYFSKVALCTIYLYGDVGLSKDFKKAKTYIDDLFTPECMELLVQIRLEKRWSKLQSKGSYKAGKSYRSRTY